MKKSLVLFFIVLFIGYIFVNLLTLVKFPPVWRDDVWMNEPAWRFLNSQGFSSGIFEGFYGLGKSDTYHGRIYAIAVAGIFKLFGCGPYQGRVVSFFSAMLTALFTYLIGKRLFDRSTGIIATILLMLSSFFIFNSHIGRQDMMLSLFIVMAIYLYIWARDKSSVLLFFLCGLVSSLSVDVHFNGLLLPLVVGALFLFDYRRNILKKIVFFQAYILGVMIGIIYWVITHILIDPFIFWHQWRYYLWKDFRPPIFSLRDPIKLVLLEISRYKYMNIFELVVIVCALLFRNKTKNRLILSQIVFIFIVLFFLLVTHKASFYIIYLYPFFMLSIASFSYLSKKQTNIIIGKTMVLILAFFYIFQDAIILYKFRECDYYSYINKLKKFVEPKSAIAGQPTWWYAFYDTNKYYAIPSINLSGKDISDIIRKKDIKYFLVDEYWRENFPDNMEDFLAKSCEHIGELKDKFYGAENFYPSKTYYKLDIYRTNNNLENG